MLKLLIWLKYGAANESPQATVNGAPPDITWPVDGELNVICA